MGSGYLRPDQFLDHLTVIKREYIVLLRVTIYNWLSAAAGRGGLQRPRWDTQVFRCRCAFFYPFISVPPFILVLSLFPVFFFVRPESNHCLASSLGYPWCFEGSNLIVGWLGLRKSWWCCKWCWTKSASIFCEHAFCVSSTGYMETWLNKISLEEMLWLKSFSFHQTFIWSLIKQRSCFIF